MNHSSRPATELWRWILRGALFVLAPQLCACSAQGDAMGKTAATEMPEAEPSSRELDSSSETEQSAALSDATTAEPSLPTGTCHGVEGLETDHRIRSKGFKNRGE